jgi:hypothetical protein
MSNIFDMGNLMNTLSYQEKTLYAELLGEAAFLGVLLAYRSLFDSHALSEALCAYSIAYFGYSFLVTRRFRFRFGDYLIDERDWWIESKGIRMSHIILSTGVIFLLIRIKNAPTLSATGIFKRLFIILVLSSVAKSVQMLRLYRASK